MSALKHGFFRVGFMLCDRCAWNGDCKRFRAGGECGREKRVFKKLVSELIDEFELESVADKILVERVGMYLIRIARAEAYEAAMGVSDKSALWGGYVSRLDNTLRGLMNDLAVTRVKRKQLEKKEALLVSVDDLMEKFVHKKGEELRGMRRISIRSTNALMSSWRKDYKKLSLSIRRKSDFGQERT